MPSECTAHTGMLPSPFTNLDTLYHQVLATAQPEHIDAILTIFCIMLRYQGPYSTLAGLAHIMGISVQDIHILLYDLHSIVKVSDNNSPIEFFHASFSDFLKSETRAGRYYIGKRGKCAQVIQLFLQAVLNQYCDCKTIIVDGHANRCHHVCAYRSWFGFLPDVEPTPTLLKLLEQFLLKASKDLEFHPVICQDRTCWHMATSLRATVAVIAWLRSCVSHLIMADLFKKH